MKRKFVFLDKRVYWILIILLICTGLAHVLLLNRRFELLTLLHILWISAVLLLMLNKHKDALLNIKIWLITVFIAGPLIRMARRLLNEILDGFSASQVEFYLYRVLSVTVGLIVLNLVRSTITVEESSVNT